MRRPLPLPLQLYMLHDMLARQPSLFLDRWMMFQMCIITCSIRRLCRLTLHVVIPTTVGTYMRALNSSTTVAAQEERRSTRVYQRRAANPTPGSAVDSRRAGAAEACALHAGNALVHTSSTMHNDSMRDALCVVGHKGASSIAEHVRCDIGADVGFFWFLFSMHA